MEPTNHTEDNRRIAKNTAYLYLRSLFNLLLALYTSRWVLQALGVDDYGIYNVVGGFAGMFWSVSWAITSSVTRFLSYEMGCEGQANLKKIFSTSLTLLSLLSLVLTLFAETIGVWYLLDRMSIPAGRETAAMIVFQTSVFTSILTLVVAPFDSAIIAHQRLGVYSFTSICETALLFLFALLLVKGNISLDKLILYAYVRAAITTGIRGYIVWYTYAHFEECRFRYAWDKKYFSELFKFAGWSFIGSIAYMFSGHGINLTLNHFFGTAVNAARGLAFTVSNSVSIFVNNFTNAVVPQLSTSYAEEDYVYLKQMVFQSSKLTFFLMLLFIIPLTFEADYVLDLWLAEVPEHTVNFVRLSMLVSLFGVLDSVIWQAQRATGEIRKNTIITSSLHVMIFVLSYLALYFGFPAETVYVVTALCTFCIAVSNTYLITRSLGYRLGELLRSIFLPELLVLIVSALVVFAVHRLLPYGFLRLFVVVLVSSAAIVSSAFFIAYSREERVQLLQKASVYLRRFTGK